MRSAFQAFVERRQANFFQFIDKRISASNCHTLSHKNVFIFPTGRGFVFLLIVVVLWILGTNYQNNLILGLAFFMVSLFVLAILLTFQNLNRVSIQFHGLVGDAFAGEECQFRFALSKSGRQLTEELEITWQGGEGDKSIIFEVGGDVEDHIVPYFCKKRGRQMLPRMRVQSYFPLGIIRCWTWLRWQADVVVFPKPINGTLGNSLQGSENEADGLHPVKGGDDFSGLKEYVEGDSLRRVAWKTFAKGRGLFVKDFSESLSSEKWLDFNSVHAVSAEEKLSILTFWVLHYYQENENFGLILPAQKIRPNLGRAHRNLCLNSLAES